MSPRAVLAALGLLGLAGCSRAPTSSAPAVEGELCASPPTTVVASLCTLQQARAQALDAERNGAMATCSTIQDQTWRDECHYQSAELMALDGAVEDALLLCNAANGFEKSCRARVVWAGSAEQVSSSPDDPDAQRAVAEFIDRLPPRTEGVRDGDSFQVARAAAWHDIYAGSGSADPTAALGADRDDARYARTAFAWEATRLLGDDLDTQALVDQVIAVWQGDLLPPTGDPVPHGCWQVTPMPSVNAADSFRDPSAPIYPSGVRFAEDDPETDLMVAVLHASWMFGQDVDPALVAGLVGSGSEAARKTAARLIGLMPDHFESTSKAFPEQGRLSRFAKTTRYAFEKGKNTHGLHQPRTTPCP